MGAGFVLGSIETHDALARGICVAQAARSRRSTIGSRPTIVFRAATDAASLRLDGAPITPPSLGRLALIVLA